MEVFMRKRTPGTRVRGADTLPLDRGRLGTVVSTLPPDSYQRRLVVEEGWVAVKWDGRANVDAAPYSRLLLVD
jgi:hypothetical protein